MRTASSKGWKWNTRRALIFFIALLAPITFAVVGLWLEVTVERQWWGWASLGGLILLALAVALRDRLTESTGTLYYIRLLGESMFDWHEKTLSRLSRGHLSTRRVTRTLSLPSSFDATDVLDIAADVEEVTRALQETMNDDDSSTAFHLAPNLLWPAALALGYDTHLRPGTVFRDVAKELDRDVPWPASALAESGAGDAWAHGGTARIEVRASEPEVPGGASLVIAELTDKPGATHIDYGVQNRFRVAAFTEPGNVDSPRQQVWLLPKRPWWRRWPMTNQHRGRIAATPEEMTRSCVSGIRQAVHASQGKPVFLALRLPKTVGVAVGHQLRFSRCQEEHCAEPACVSPWTVLIPLNYDPRAHRYLATRAHRFQPHPDELRTKLRAALP